MTVTAARSVTPRLAWAVLGLLWFTYVLNYVDRQVVFSIFPVLRAELSFSDFQLGLIGTIFTWVYSLSMPITGRLADRFRRDFVIVASLILWSLATLGTAMSRSVTAFLTWRLVMGLTESLYVPAALSTIARMHAGSTRSMALSIHASAQFAGIALGGWYGGYAADHIGWRPGFFTLAGAGILYAAILSAALRKIPRSATAGAEATAATSGGFLRSRCYLALCVCFFAFTIILWMLYAWLPTFIYEKFGLSLTASGSLATLYLQAGSLVGVLAGGALADRLVTRHPAARFYIVGVGFLLAAPLAHLTLAVNSLDAVRAASAGFGLLAGFGVANVFAAAYDVIPVSNYGLGAGSLNMLGGLSGGAGILAAGWWKNSFGVAGLVSVSAAVSAVMAIAMMLVVAAYFARDRSRL